MNEEASRRIGEIGVTTTSLRPAHLALLYLSFLGAAALAQTLELAPSAGVSVWLPSGLYMTALLLAPVRRWPWLILAGCAAELTGNALWYRNPLPVALIVHAGNAAEASIGALFLRRAGGRDFQLRSLRDVAALLAFGAALAPAVSAGVGSATMALAAGRDFDTSFVRWYVSDATGVVVMAPIVLLIATRGEGAAPVLTPWRIAEAALLFVAFVVVATFSLGGGRGSYVFWVIAPLLWAAIRFEFAGAVAASVILAALSSAFTHAGVSPFSLDGPSASRLIPFQLFLLLSSASGLAVAAMARQQRDTLSALLVANEALERRVAERTAALGESEARLRLALSAGEAGAWDLDIETGRMRWTEAHYRLFGYEPDREGRATLQMWRSAVHPEDLPRVLEEWARAEAAGDDFACEYRIRRRGDGVVAHMRGSGRFVYGSDGRPTRFSGVVFDVSEQKRQEQRLRMLINELSHRVKNTLASVQSIALQSLKGREGDVSDFLARLGALAAGHDLLARQKWEGAMLADVVARTAGAQAGARLHVEPGPAIRLPPRQALALAMALHELTTNALKYGALSVDKGRVEVGWEIVGDRFRLVWRESGGPPVAAPRRRGFGTRLLERGLKHDLDGEISIEFRSEGVVCVIDAPAPDAATHEPDLVMWR